MVKVINDFGVKNQYVIYDCDRNYFIFQSYETIVCKIKDKIYLNKKAWLSRTTRKYLYWFLTIYANLAIKNNKDLQKHIENKNIILKDFNEC